MRRSSNLKFGVSKLRNIRSRNPISKSDRIFPNLEPLKFDNWQILRCSEKQVDSILRLSNGEIFGRDVEVLQMLAPREEVYVRQEGKISGNQLMQITKLN